ncbi:MAG: hypothetical protein AAGA97_00970 [Pseudomonadota bacterium]
MINLKNFATSLCSISVFLLSVTSKSYALTGKEMIENFNGGDRYLYIAGMVDMASYQALLDNDHQRARCIQDWFHKDNQAAMHQIGQLFVNYQDKHAEPLVVVLINRACGKPDE